MKNLLIALTLFLASINVNAASYSQVINYTADDEFTFLPGGDLFGTPLHGGDQLSLTLQTTGDDFWVNDTDTISAGFEISSPGYIGGDVKGSLAATLSYKGVDSYNLTSMLDYDEGRAWDVFTTSDFFGLKFDKVIVNFKVDSLEYKGDGAVGFADPTRNASYVSAVPIPAAAFMFAPALLGFLGFRRKIRA